MFKKIVLGIVAIIALILIFALTKPATYTVARSTTIKAPPETVYSFIDDFHKWEPWSPWEKMDPAMKRTYAGAANGKGAVYTWDGNSQVGKGRMEISNVSAPAKVDINLDFLAPMAAHSDVEFSLVPQGDSTSVTWTMIGENNYLSKLMQVFVSMDNMIGPDFESGLAGLKAAAEKAAPTMQASPSPETPKS